MYWAKRVVLGVLIAVMTAAMAAIVRWRSRARVANAVNEITHLLESPAERDALSRSFSNAKDKEQ
jgi:hypothetical protein